MNINCKRSNKILLSEKEWRLNHLLWQKYSPSHFQCQQLLLRSPGLELLRGWVKIWKAVHHLRAMPLDTHYLVSQCDLYKQHVPPHAFLTYWPAVYLHVTQVHSAPAHEQWASAHSLNGVLFYKNHNETWRQLRCVLLILEHHREGNARGISLNIIILLY